MTSFAIAIALTLVCDKQFNHGGMTVKLFDSAAWIVRSGDEVAASFTGFRGS